METKEKPEWATERGAVDEVRFCEKFMMKHYIIYQDGAFFSPEGRIADEDRLRHLIYQELCDYVRSSVAAKVESLLSTLRLVASQTCLKEGAILTNYFGSHAYPTDAFKGDMTPFA